MDASLGDLLRRHRVAVGLTQEQLADRAGMSVRGLSDLERGLRRAPHRDTVLRLSEALGLQSTQAQHLLAAARRQREPSDPSSTSGGRLPSSSSSLVGREREIQEVLRTLHNARLVTLTGPGGIGKTRLALEVGRRTASTGWEVSLVEFASINASSLVHPTTAAVLGIEEQPGTPYLATLARVLTARALLLILDNCEHVIDACAELVDALLRSCPEVHILATSREPLAIDGETVWQVSTLSLPEPQTSPTPEALAQTEAVQLFIQRAMSVRPDFRLTPANATEVARICQRLDGVPLALELAAARVRMLSTRDIAERLGNSLHLLVRGNRVAAPRQHTLQATLDWSYMLLQAEEQRVFEQLSVFAGGWSLDAAESVCGDGDTSREEVPNVLGRLVDKSLVLAEHRNEHGVRYRLLETVRQYSTAWLSQHQDTPNVRQRHAQYFLERVESAGPDLDPPRQAWWFNWLHQELDNLRAAIDWAVETGDAKTGLRIAATMRLYWFHVHPTEGQSRLQRLLDMPSAAADPAARAAGLVALGYLTRARTPVGASQARKRDDLAMARSAGEEGLTLARQVRDQGLVHRALLTLSWTAAIQEDWDTAHALLQESLQLGQTLGELQAWVALGRLGGVLVLQDKDAHARTLLEDSVAGLRAVGADEYVAQYLCLLADVAVRHQRFDEAHRYAREALEAAHRLGYAWAHATTALHILVRVASAECQFERAVRLAGAVSAMHPGIGRFQSRMSSPEVLAFAKQQLGSGKAEVAWADGLAMSREQAVAVGLTI